MGHSWGTVVGMGAALKRPDLLHAYAGIGQNVNTRENERISFEFGLAQRRHDYTTPSETTAKWLAAVKAPYKQAVWFERSSHMIPWEEPGKMLVSLLKYVRPLAEPATPDPLVR